MNDYLGNTIAVLDRVCFVRPNIRELACGSVTGFTPKRARITCDRGRKYTRPSHLLVKLSGGDRCSA